MKWVKIIAISIGVPALVLIVAIPFGVLQIYRSPTNANTPGISPGSRFFATNIISPERFDYVCFRHKIDGQEAVIVSRLCALEGETVEFKNGICYVNGENQETDLILKHRYIATGASALQIIDQFDLIEWEDYYKDPFSDTVRFYATTELVKKNPDMIKDTTAFYFPEIEQIWGNRWSNINFGPVTVPADHYFVIGDNREDCRDSRFLGAIPEENIVGVVFYK